MCVQGEYKNLEDTKTLRKSCLKVQNMFIRAREWTTCERAYGTLLQNLRHQSNLEEPNSMHKNFLERLAIRGGEGCGNTVFRPPDSLSNGFLT